MTSIGPLDRYRAMLQMRHFDETYLEEAVMPSRASIEAVRTMA
jgi:hypothetical protein